MDLTKWWWATKEGRELHQFLNKLTTEERNSPKYYNVCQAMLKRYGAIYFFQPYPAQEPILKDESENIYIHGNNSSGKSYVAAAATAYQFVGWSPYYDIPAPKYGDRLIWAFSPTFDLQRTSSQVHLFATDSPGSIGLLPSLETIEDYGGKVVWGKRTGCLDYVEIPASWGVHRTKIEFKSGEMQAKNLQASGLDWNWFDEYVTEEHHEEITARLMRKNGRLIMSFILRPIEIADSYITKSIYREFVKGERQYANFHFLHVTDNKSLTPEEIELHLSRYTAASRVWRFSEGGFFNLEPYGDKVFHNYIEDSHRVENILTNYDFKRQVFLSWDLGYIHPVCIAAQVDRNNRINILFSIMGSNIPIINFIDEVDAFMKEYMPDVLALHDVIPHDGRRHSDKVDYTTEQLFKNLKRGQVTVAYTKRDKGFELCNKQLGIWMNKLPKIQLDLDHAEELANTLKVYVNDEKTGLPVEDNYHEHYADAFKQLIVFLDKLHNVLYGADETDPAVPNYFTTKQRPHVEEIYHA